MPPRRTQRLVHFSPERLSVVDPAHYGRNPWTNVREEQAHYPRSYWYRDTPARPAVPERVVLVGSRYGHAAEAKLAIYDMARDPLGVFDRPASWAEYEQRIRAAGYQGVANTSHPHHALRTVVAVWEPVAVTRTWAL